MAPTPPLPFKQALALLQSGEHRRGSQTTRSSHPPHSSRNTEPSAPILPYQDALAILQHGDHRRHSRSHLLTASSHEASPSLSSSSRSPHRDQSPPSVVPFQQALAMLQRGEHRAHRRGISSFAHQNQVSAAHMHRFPVSRDRLQHSMRSNATTQRAGTSHNFRFQELLAFQEFLATLHREENRSIAQSIELVNSMPAFQELLATLYRGDNQSNGAQVYMYNARSRLQTTNSGPPQEIQPRPVSSTSTYALHSPSSSSSSSSSHHDRIARRGQNTHQQVDTRNAHTSEGNGNGNSSTMPHKLLANLPSLGFEEACKTICWRSATRYEIMNCGICLDDFESEDKVHLFPNCNHLFHVECVKDWLLKRGSCPCCRDIIISIKEPAQQ